MALNKTRTPCPRPVLDVERFTKARQEVEPMLDHAVQTVLDTLRDRAKDLRAAEVLAAGADGGYQLIKPPRNGEARGSASLQRLLLVSLALGARVRLQIDGVDMLPARCNEDRTL